MSVRSRIGRLRSVVGKQDTAIEEKNGRQIRGKSLAAVIFILGLLAAGQMFRFGFMLRDGTVWTGTPSDVYIAGAAPNSPNGKGDSSGCPHLPEPGDFLLAVDQNEAVSVKETYAYLSSVAPRAVITLKIYRFLAGSVYECSLSAEAAVAIPLRPSPGVLIRQVKEGGPADRIGVIPGDVVLAIADQHFEGRISAGPVGALIVMAQGVGEELWFKAQSLSRVMTSIEAQNVLAEIRPGAEVTYRVLRKGGLHDVQLRPARSPASILIWIILGLGFMHLLGHEGLLIAKRSLASPIYDLASYRPFASSVLLCLSIIVALQIFMGANSFMRTVDLACVTGFIAIHFFSLPGRPSPRRTPVLLIALLALVLTYFLWFWHTITWSKIISPDEEPGYFTLTGVRAKVFGNGNTFLSGDTAVPVLTLAVFLLAVLLLYQFWRRFLGPVSPLHRVHHPLCQAAMSGNAEILERLLNNEATEVRNSYYGSRFLRLISRLNKDPADGAPERERLTILEEDEEEAAAVLAPVGWCETALPVLGFLGTVIGLARSLSDLQGLEVTGEVSVKELLDTLLSAFEGVGYAFDTTFLGLASMLVIAGFHTALRRAASRRFAEAGAVFKAALRLWVTTSSARDLREATADRESARAMIERVLLLHSSPTISEAREILYPVVTFHKLLPPPDQEFQNWLGANAEEGWNYTAFGLSRAVPEQGLLVAEAPQGARWVARLELNGSSGAVEDQQGRPIPGLEPTRRVLSIYPAEGSERFTVRTADGRLLSGDLSEDSFLEVPLPEAAQQADVLSVVLGDHDFLLMGWNTLEGYELHALRVGSTELLRLGSLGEQLHEHRWAVHEPSGTVFRLGQDLARNGRWFILQKQMRLPLASGSSAVPASGETESKTAVWHHEKKPANLLPLGKDRLLVVTQDGSLFYWDLGHGNFTPLRHDGWRPVGVPLMINGVDGWFAVISQQLLRMWQVRPHGILIPYAGEAFPVGDLNEDHLKKGRLQATASGKFLLAVTDGKTLATWRFPRFSIDA